MNIVQNHEQRQTLSTEQSKFFHKLARMDNAVVRRLYRKAFFIATLCYLVLERTRTTVFVKRIPVEQES